MTPRMHLALMITVTVSVVALFSPMTSTPVYAHDPAVWYPAKWSPVGIGNPIPWRFMSNFPSANGERNRVRDGQLEWNSLGEPMWFGEPVNVADYTSVNYYTCSDKTYTQDAIHWFDTGSTAAEISACAFNDVVSGGDSKRLHSFQIAFNSALNWYRGTGTPGSSQVDMWGYATHEFGHATGRYPTNGPISEGDGEGHFNSGTVYCPKDSTHHTMCRSQDLGKTWWRTLETHDKDVFRSGY